MPYHVHAILTNEFSLCFAMADVNVQTCPYATNGTVGSVICIPSRSLANVEGVHPTGEEK